MPWQCEPYCHGYGQAVDVWWELIDEPNSSPLYKTNVSAYAALAAVVGPAQARVVKPSFCGSLHFL